MKKLLVRTFFLIVVLTFGYAYGQAQPSPEVVALRAQVETMKDYQEQFVEVVLWSLGGVVALVLALLAFSFFSSKTNYDRDRRFLEQERKNIEEEIQAKMRHEFVELSEKISLLVSEREDLIKGKIEGSVLSRIGNISSRLDDLKDDVLDLRYDALKREAEEGERSNQIGWAIYKYRQMLEISITRGFDFQFSDLLDSIKKCLSSSSLKVDSDELSELSSVLKRLPPKYGVASEHLIEIARNKL